MSLLIWRHNITTNGLWLNEVAVYTSKFNKKNKIMSTEKSLLENENQPSLLAAVRCSFVLYSEKIDGIKEYEKKEGKYVALKEPIKIKMIGVYRHTFGCTLSEALKEWACIKQILSFDRSYHAIIDDKSQLNQGTRFNIFFFPLVYLYSLIDKRMFHKVKVFF